MKVIGKLSQRDKCWRKRCQQVQALLLRLAHLGAFAHQVVPVTKQVYSLLEFLFFLAHQSLLATTWASAPFLDLFGFQLLADISGSSKN